MSTSSSFTTPAQDFWRSGAGATTQPDGATDLTENIRRNGLVGLGVDPVSTLDVAGSFGVNFTTSAVAVVPIPIGVATVNLTSGVAQAVALPAAAASTRRILTFINRTVVGKTVSIPYLALAGGTSNLIAANSEVTIQSDGVSWVEVSNSRSPASTANFSQVVASGSINIGDPIPAGARPFTNFFNLLSAAGLDGPATDARMQVNFVTPAANADYIVSGSLRSIIAANWNLDNEVIWAVVSKSVTGFVISTRELNSVAQGLFFDFECTTFQNAPATPSLPEIAQFVALDTPVALDNIRLEARLTGGQGFRVATVAGAAVLNISAVTSFATASVFGSNVAGFAASPVMVHPFAWAGQTAADGMNGQIYDRTSNRFYEFTIMTNVGPVLSFIRIKRVL